MTVRSILEIDVKDDKFKVFLELFNKYNAQLKEMPGTWTEASAASAASAMAMKESTEELERQAAVQRKKDQDEARALKSRGDEEKKRIDNAKRRMESIKESTEKIAKNVASTTVDLLRWASIGSLASGLLGLGSLFGIDRLASSVSDVRRAAQGVGVTPGQQQALGVNYNRYFDVNSNLESIAEAKSNYAHRWAFGAMGVNANGKDPAQLAVEMAMRAKQVFDSGDQSQQSAQAHGLLQFYTMDELRRLHTISMKELRQAETGYGGDVGTGYGGDVGTFSRADEVNKSWQDFSVQLTRAGTTIESALVKGLLPLVPQLTTLSASLAVDITKLLANPHIGEWIDDLAQGLKVAAEYLGSDKFQTDLKTFVDDVAYASQKIVAGLKFLKLIPDGPADTQAMPNDQNTANVVAPTALGGWLGSHFGPLGTAIGAGVGFLGGALFTGDARKGFLQQQEHDYGLQPGTLQAIYGLESNYGKNAGTSSAGAKGPFQLMPGTAKQYGVTDTSSFNQEALAAAMYMKKLMRMFNGDVRKALAAYNWGEGNLQKDIAAHGADWLRFAPKETQNYVAKGQVLIKVNNNTGGNANVQANQAAAH